MSHSCCKIFSKKAISGVFQNQCESEKKSSTLSCCKSFKCRNLGARLDCALPVKLQIVMENMLVLSEANYKHLYFLVFLSIYLQLE